MSLSYGVPLTGAQVALATAAFATFPAARVAAEAEASAARGSGEAAPVVACSAAAAGTAAVAAAAAAADPALLAAGQAAEFGAVRCAALALVMTEGDDSRVWSELVRFPLAK